MSRRSNSFDSFAIAAFAAIVLAAGAAPAGAESRPPDFLFGTDQPSRAIGSRAYDDLFAAETPPAFEPSISEASLSAASIFQEPHVPPRHTGFKALVFSTGADFKAFPQRVSTWVILGIGAGAAGIAYPFDDDLNDKLKDEEGLRKFFTPGKYLGYGWVQASAAIGTYVIGRFAYHPGEGRTNKVSHLGFDLLRANILTQALTYGFKYAVQRDRPTGECCSFPSGHASVTFATASVLERHFGYRGAWPTFVVAGYVAASRLTENKHFLGDVLFGAALGMASGWTVVGRHGRSDFAMYPVPVRGGMGVTMTWTPGASKQGDGSTPFR
ncbi:MAG TPA: phosphatase PAP2 family protein [Vicinamibacterales bacterium]|nr:phosphatase PAP2 family protein [Vicinamibacterales bacterium]